MKKIAEEYAGSKQRFREDVRAAYATVQNLGPTYIGASRLIDATS